MDEMSRRIAEYDPLLRGIIFRMIGAPNPTLLDEMMLAGREGVWTALETFDESKGCTLNSYVGAKAKWSMQDYSRDTDHLSRNHRKGVREDTREDPFSDVGHAQIVDHITPYDHLVGTNMVTEIDHVLTTHRHSDVYIRHFNGENLKAIGEDINFTESRICQMVSNVRVALKYNLGLSSVKPIANRSPKRKKIEMFKTLRKLAHAA